ncbi:MAG: ABC transporter ATP-binding protein [Desulfobacteraceae bacterium]|jgi:iron complex transport system ATP-binding protein|nr:ABC transporter ATP-binding protein [Desulfobacteraceae bacterium]
MILNVAGLIFSYNSHPVLDGVTFSVSPKELVAVLGPNGVGKTTLLRCINAIHRPSGGAVFVDARDVRTMPPAAIARSVGYVAQRNEPTRLTAFDAVLMGRRPHLRWGVTHRDLEIVDAALQQLRLTELSMRYTDQMSGGELQKVAIARALVQEPRLLLLDEPTASLDLKNQVDILGFIRNVVTEHAVAAVMTLHDLNTALRTADTCLFLKDGKIAFAGSPQQVDAEIIESVYGLPVEVYCNGGRVMVAPHG